MKKINILKISLLFVLICSFSNLISQNADSTEHPIFLKLKNSSENQIKFSCGRTGKTSDNLFYIRTLIREQRFDLIEQLLNSDVPATKYLSIVTLLHAKKLALYQTDLIPIDKRTNKNEIIAFCSGCTIHESNSIHALLKANSKITVQNQVVKWIVESFDSSALPKTD